MNALNKIFLIGRLTRDPELRFTPANGVPVTNFTLAVDRPFLNRKGEREADFIRIVAWRKLAEICANNLQKGRLVCVFGRLQVRNYETQEGERRTISEVVADEVQFLDKPKQKSETPDLGDIGSEIDFDDVMEGPEDDGVPF